MPYYIDGHNLLGQTPGMNLTSAADRQSLVASLASFARSRRCRIVVVFDGEPQGGWRKEMSFGPVKVNHSGRGRSADDFLLDAIARSRAPADITLVTSDRALYERARHRGAAALRGDRFRVMMAEANRRRDAGSLSEKPERPGPGEIDYFLEAFGAASPSPAAELPEDPPEGRGAAPPGRSAPARRSRRRR